jgi:hypothetical protein
MNISFKVYRRVNGDSLYWNNINIRGFSVFSFIANVVLMQVVWEKYNKLFYEVKVYE